MTSTGPGSALRVFTIGHSNHDWERFGSLLDRFGVTAIADVRSTPVSGRSPHFSQDELVPKLRDRGIAYVFLGRELGGRPASRALFHDGIADYDKMARLPDFEAGLTRVVAGAAQYRLALMCSEQDPMDCHRCLLVGRRLKERRVCIDHILADGTSLTQDAVEDWLLGQAGAATVDDLFFSRSQQIDNAYLARSRKVAFADDARKGPATVVAA